MFFCFFFVSQLRQLTFLENDMKKTFRQLLIAAAGLLTAFAATAAPPTSPGERTPTVQQFTLFNRGVETVGFKVAPTGQPQAANQLVRQRHFDPPVMIQTVLPLGATSSRTPWLDAAFSGKPDVTQGAFAAKSPSIPTLWNSGRVLSLLPNSDYTGGIVTPVVSLYPDGNGIVLAHGGGSGGITTSNGGGSSCVDRMPGITLIT